MERIAVNCENGVGFDVLSFDGGEWSIEVKTTGLGEFVPFVATAAEVRCSEDIPSRSDSTGSSTSPGGPGSMS